MFKDKYSKRMAWIETGILLLFLVTTVGCFLLEMSVIFG